MSDSKRFSPTDIPHRVRSALEEAPESIKSWKQQVRENPSAVFDPTLIRVGIYIVAGLLLFAGMYWLVGLLTPEFDPKVWQEPTAVATLYVACTNSECLQHSTVKKPMDFAAWPIDCGQCGQATVRRASVCKSCAQWSASDPETGRCPVCVRRESEQNRQREQIRKKRSTDPDDLEDGWG